MATINKQMAAMQQQVGMRSSVPTQRGQRRPTGAQPPAPMPQGAMSVSQWIAKSRAPS